MKSWLAVFVDGANFVAAVGNLTADVASLALTSANAAAAVKSTSLLQSVLPSVARLEWMAKWAGRVAGGASLVVGAFQIAQGVADDHNLWTIVQGGGNVAIGIGFWLDVLVSRFGARLVVQIGLGEVGALVLGETVLLALGSILTVVGILATIVALAATHWDEVMRIAYALFAPGTEKFVDTFLKQVAAVRAVKVGPGSVRDAVAAALAASATAGYVTWVSWSATVNAELRGLGLNDGDLKLLRTIPTPVGSPMGP
jgi:hypothetical protein